MKSQWWFAADVFQNGFSRLMSTTAEGSSNRDFLDAQKMTITFTNAWIRDEMDGGWKKTNDLIITSKHAVGSKPPVDKIHFYKDHFPSKKFVGASFHPIIYATNDFRTDAEEITLQLRIYDEDGLSDSEKKGIESAIGSATAAAAIAFPAFAPIAGLTSGVGSALVGLIDNLNNHDKIIDGIIRLAINRPADRGYDLLQPGFYVCFADDVDAGNLFLGNDRKLYLLPPDPSSQPSEFLAHSYVIIRVDRTYLLQSDLAIDEKAATLLSEIEAGKQQATSSALSFLRETLTAYNNFRRLQRYTELKNKGAKITQDEQALVDEMKKDPTLSPYLPS